MIFKAISRVLLGAVAVLLALSAGACASSSSATTALTACHVTASALVVPGGGKSTAPTLPAGTLSIDGSSALAPLFQRAARDVPANAANSTVTVNVTPNGSGTGLNDVENGTVQIGMSDVFAQEKATAATSFSDLVDNQVAVVPFTLVVSEDISAQVHNLTTRQIKD